MPESSLSVPIHIMQLTFYSTAISLKLLLVVIPQSLFLERSMSESQYPSQRLQQHGLIFP